MRRPPNGFTLLELLMTLAIMGFIIVEIGQGLDFGLRASTLQAGLVGHTAELDGVDRLLRGLIARMDPGSRNSPPQLAGRHDGFSFTTTLPPDVASPLVRTVDATLVLSDERLLLRWVPHLHSGVHSAQSATAIVLLTGVRRLELSYLQPAGGAAAGWADRWAEPYLPRLVRIHLGFSPGDARHWADIVAEPAEDRPE